MEAFLKLQRNVDSKVPPITDLLSKVSGDLNSSFYKIANTLFYSENLNETYSLISLRDIIDLSPLNIEKEIGPDELIPSASFKWLLLIHSLTSRQISGTPEIEKAKISYVFEKIKNFVLQADLSKLYTDQFLVGLLCVVSHMIDSVNDNECSKIFNSADFFDKLYELFQLKEFKAAEKYVISADFPEIELLNFCMPVSLEYLSSQNLFSDMKLLFHTSILRLLYRILPIGLPENVEEFRKIVQPLCVHGLTSDLSMSVLIQLFNGESESAYRYSDTIQYTICTETLSKMATQTKSFQLSLSYQDNIKLSKALNQMDEVAEKHSEYLVDFVKSNPSISSDLTSLAMSNAETDFINAALSLMRLGNITATESLIPHLFQLLIAAQSKLLRKESGAILLSTPELALPYALSIIKDVPNCGCRSADFFDFLERLLPKVNEKEALEVVSAVINSIKNEQQTLAHLPNAFIYTQLSQYIDVNASYLDPKPCLICNNPEISHTKISLNDIKDYSKYTHNEVRVKLLTPLYIQSFTLNLNVRKTGRIPRIVRIFVSSAELKDSIELLDDSKTGWRHVCDLEFGRDSRSASADLPLSLFATCIRFHFTAFWEEADGGASKLCPMCHRGSPDKRSGICPNCHENIYQCRECRNIDWQCLDAFICSECGYSNFCSFDWRINAYRSFSHTHLGNDGECDAALKKSDELLAAAHKAFVQLTVLRSSIEDVLSPACKFSIGEKTSELNNLYNDKCRNIFSGMTTTVQHVFAIRRAVAQFKARASKSASTSEFNTCYNCRTTYVKNALAFLVVLAKVEQLRPISSALDVPGLLINFAESDPTFGSVAISSLTQFCALHSALTQRVVDLFMRSLENPSPPLVRLVCELEGIDDGARSGRFQILLDAANKCTEMMNSSGSFTPVVLQPLMTTICKSPLIIRNADLYMKYKIYSEGFGGKPAVSFDPLRLFPREALMSLFVDCPSEIVRVEIAELLKNASQLDEDHFNEVLDITLEVIGKIERVSDEYIQVFGVMLYMLKDHRCMRQAFHRGMLEKSVSLLQSEVSRVLEIEGSLSLDLSVGRSVNVVMGIVSTLLSPVAHVAYIVAKKPVIATSLVKCYFQLRSLLIQRSKYLEDTLSFMLKFIMQLMSQEFVLDKEEEEEEPEKHETSQPSSPPQDHFHYYNEYGYEDEEDDIPLPSFTPTSSPSKKDLSEEESIKRPNVEGPRLMMTAAAECVALSPEIAIREIVNIVFPPKVEKNVPVLMRKIRTQEDFIPGRLPNQAVMSHTIGSLMRDIKNNICNSLGMPGMIEDDNGMELLVNNNIISLDLPIADVYDRIWIPTHGTTSMLVVCRLQGLDGEATEPMISSFPSEATEYEDPEKKFEYTTVLAEGSGLKSLIDATALPLPQLSQESLAKLLGTFVLVEKNREAMLRMGAIGRLFDMMSHVVDTNNAELLSSIIDTTSKLLAIDPSTDDKPDEHVDFVHNALQKPLLRNNEQLVAPFLALVPPLALRSESTMRKVLVFFMEEVKDGENSMFEHPKAYFMLNVFAEFVRALPLSKEGNSMREMINGQGVLDDALAFLVKSFPPSETKTSRAWQAGVEVAGMPALLKLIAGMVGGYAPCQQRLLDNSCELLHLMLSLEGVASSQNIGEYASTLLEAASKEPSIVKPELERIRKEAKEAARRKARAQRERAMAMAKMSISAKLVEEVKCLQEQSEWECCICKESYVSMPDELLSMYVFNGHVGNFCNTATHLICIHPNCHRRARAVDNHDRGALTEWEAALVRNCERPCNAMFPLPSRSLKNYKKEVESFLNDRSRGGDYFMQLMNDVKIHLTKLANNERIDLAHGGGSIPNIVGFLPLLVYSGHLFLEDNGLRRGLETRFEKLLNDNAEEASVTSLWLMTADEWARARAEVLKRLVKSWAVNSANASPSQLFERARPALILFILVDRMQTLLKGKGNSETAEGAPIVGNNKDASFITQLSNRALDNGPELVKEWVRFGTEVETKILEISDAKTALQEAGFIEESERATAFLKECIS